MPGPGPVSEQGDGRSYGRIGDVPRTAVTVVMDMTADGCGEGPVENVGREARVKPTFTELQKLRGRPTMVLWCAVVGWVCLMCG